jgi:hypothetical protein
MGNHSELIDWHKVQSNTSFTAAMMAFHRSAAEAIQSILSDNTRLEGRIKKDTEIIWLMADHKAHFDETIGRLEAEVKVLKQDAERYRWLRMQDWFDGELCVLRDPKKVFSRPYGLGADCPSRDRLDAAIDAALAQGEGQ